MVRGSHFVMKKTVARFCLPNAAFAYCVVMYRSLAGMYKGKHIQGSQDKIIQTERS